MEQWNFGNRRYGGNRHSHQAKREISITQSFMAGVYGKCNAIMQGVYALLQ